MEIEAQGERIVVVVSFDVPATLAEVWAALTDYDHMADFSPNLEYSNNLGSGIHTLQVVQKGKAFFGQWPTQLAYCSVFGRLSAEAGVSDSAVC